MICNTSSVSSFYEIEVATVTDIDKLIIEENPYIP